MKCPTCEHENSRVMESRDLEDGASIRRRRECLDCGHRYTTYERIERPPLMVIKKDGRREPFKRDNIASGIYRACEKRPIPAERIESLINSAELRVRSLGEIEVTVAVIGEIVMEALLQLDDVAYVRFASVYRSFTDVASFEAELQRLKSKSPRTQSQ
jgi:transcriptional regulator NrdR